MQVYSLRVDSLTWKEHTADVGGEVPPPLTGAAAVALPDGRHMALFGGTSGTGGAPPSNKVVVLDTHEWRYMNPTVQVRNWLAPAAGAVMYPVTELRGCVGAC